ncbi:hypothetical protein HIM_08118 [Hirsutella minnesotensis 3608]|uniref:ribonuclease T1 n=1 Tax=Hirsutella minnesotensis 3608 TaxID=1043627 RepID=A0A0F8A3U7_9HYPO|nr:hypothetical protein HIM_08118 [Hirsutella minnesotensis 3608]
MALFNSLYSLIVSVAMLVALVSAQAPSAIRCGNKIYSADDVQRAFNEACRLARGSPQSSGYPHIYRNFENFEFRGLSGPYFEFPLTSGSPYRGGFNNCRGPRKRDGAGCVDDGESGKKPASNEPEAGKKPVAEEPNNAKKPGSKKPEAGAKPHKRPGTRLGVRPGKVPGILKANILGKAITVLDTIAGFAQAAEEAPPAPPTPDNENTRRAFVSIRNNYKAPVFNVSVVHKYSSVYKNTFKWRAVEPAVLAPGKMEVQYHHGLGFIGVDCRFFAGGVAAVPLGPIAASIAATVAGAAAGSITSTLFSSESTDGFKQHMLQSEDEGRLTEITIEEDGSIKFHSKSGSSSTVSKGIPLPQLQQPPVDKPVDVSQSFHKVEEAAERARDLQATTPQSPETQKAHLEVVKAIEEWPEAEKKAEAESRNKLPEGQPA